MKKFNFKFLYFGLSVWFFSNAFYDLQGDQSLWGTLNLIFGFLSYRDWRISAKREKLLFSEQHGQ